MPKLYFIAHTGEHAAERTSCFVEVEHFTDPLAYGRRLRQIERLHETNYDEVNTYTNGTIDPATGKGA